jgi:hypothetical protein
VERRHVRRREGRRRGRVDAVWEGNKAVGVHDGSLGEAAVKQTVGLTQVLGTVPTEPTAPARLVRTEDDPVAGVDDRTLTGRADDAGDVEAADEREFVGRDIAESPWSIQRSWRLMAQASTSTTASPGPGSAVECSTSSTPSGPVSVANAAACISDDGSAGGRIWVALDRAAPRASAHMAFPVAGRLNVG